MIEWIIYGVALFVLGLEIGFHLGIGRASTIMKMVINSNDAKKKNLIK